MTRLTSAAPVTRKNRIWDLLLLTEPSQLQTPLLFSAITTSFLSFPLPFPNLLCPLFWRWTFGEVATKLGAGTKFYHAERNREPSSSFFFILPTPGGFQAITACSCKVCVAVQSPQIFIPTQHRFQVSFRRMMVLYCVVSTGQYIETYIYSTRWYYSSPTVQKLRFPCQNWYTAA